MNTYINNNPKVWKYAILVAIILLAALSRLLPHPYNFTPIGGMALFGAAYFSQRWAAFAVPFAAMWLSDLVLNNVVYKAFYPAGTFVWWGSAWVYAAFAIIVLLGFVVLRKVRPGRILVASLSASVLFFLVTNFAVWLGSAAYPQTPAGLAACYAAGLPFFGNTIAGDLFYSALLFGVFEWAKNRLPALQQA